MSLSAGLDSINLLKNSTTKPASVSAGIGTDGMVDVATSKVSGNNSTSATAAATKKKTDLGKNDFLMLLITQLRYQDPMSPMDNTQFLSQMAQFQALEANTNIQQGIEDLGTEFKDTVAAQQSSAQSMNNASAVSLIGKEARIKETDVIWDATAGKTVPITVNLGNKSGAAVQILDSNGNVIKTLNTTTKDSQNSSTVSWDGTSDNGDIAMAGTYSVNIVGQDNDSSLYAFIQSTVTGVRFTKDGVLLKIGGRELKASDVMDVAMSNDTSSGFGGISSTSAVELLGKTVRSKQSTVDYNQVDGEHQVFKVNASPNNVVRVAITDASGNFVAAYQQTADSTGLATFDWNGQRYDGSFVDKGKYNIVIENGENDLSLYAYTEGKVDGISNLGGMVQLKVDGQYVRLSDVVDIMSGSSTASGSSI
jgi:flagellar basal-body rod modification protein FlgD